MWFRTALYLVLGLILYRFLSGLLRALAGPANPGPSPAGRPGPAGGSARGGAAHPGGGRDHPADPARPWPPGEVIDVAYKDQPPTP